MLDLYKNIKDRRIELGLTQTELAEKTGYSNKSSIASIELGKVDLPLSKIKTFAAALDCSASDLMGWDYANIDPEDIKVNEVVKPSSKQLLEIVQIAEELDDYFLDKLLDYSKKLQRTQNELNN